MEGSGEFVVRFELTILGSEGFEVQFFQIWAWVPPISGQSGLKFRHFAKFHMGSKFGFCGQTWVRKSSKFNMLGSKQFEVRYIWVRSNTSSYTYNNNGKL